MATRNNFIWYLFALFLIGAGFFATVAGYRTDGIQLIVLGGIIGAILFATGRG